MITALSLNPSIDRTVEVPGFALGATNRIQGERSIGAGKGVNVALVARRLGLPVSCLGLLAQKEGDLIEGRLRADQVPFDFVRTPGAVRVNLKILNPDNNITTELNEPGELVPVEAVQALWQRVEQAAKESAYLVLTGSLPPGVDEDFYAQALRRFAGSCRCVLDVDGPHLAAQVGLHPFLIKPNLQELEAAAGSKMRTLRDIRDSAGRLLDQGARMVVVSMGGEGAVLCTEGQALYAQGLSVQVYATVCAGDSMVAGLLYGLSQGGGPAEALRCGVAAATATVANPKEDLMHIEDFHAYYSRVKIGTI